VLKSVVVYSVVSMNWVELKDDFSKMMLYFLIVSMSVEGGEEDVEVGLVERNDEGGEEDVKVGLVEGNDEGLSVGSELGDTVAAVAFGNEIGPL